MLFLIGCIFSRPEFISFESESGLVSIKKEDVMFVMEKGCPSEYKDGKLLEREIPFVLITTKNIYHIESDGYRNYTKFCVSESYESIINKLK